MKKFKEVDPQPNFPKLEEKINKFWKENKIFEKSVENRPKEDPYVFYDGPPFISGLPHYGHLLGSIAKDVVPRYWTMKGKRCERVWGWDAHGLTVENKVQKKLGIKERKDIEKFGLKEFTEACYEYTSETSAEWNWYIDKIGRWVDMDNAYKTIDQHYMESAMWAFKQLYEKDLIYEGVRTSLYCTTCGTPVSNFEVAMDNTYREVEDPAVTIKFRVLSSELRVNKVLLLAGKHSYAKRVYYPSLKKILEGAGFEVEIIESVDPEAPMLKDDLENLRKYNFDNSIVITHSLGGLAFLKYLEKEDVNVRDLVMIAPPCPGEEGASTNKDWIEESGYFNTDQEFDYKAVTEKAGSIYVVHSEDEVVREKSFQKLVKQLNAQDIKEDGKKHYFGEDYHNESDFVNDFVDRLINQKELVEKYQNLHVLAWTTTPWTLPSNRALVIDKDADYVVVSKQKNEIELEEAWLINELPEDLKDCKSEEIEQVYVDDYSDNSGLKVKDARARRIRNNYTFTVKYVLGKESETGQAIERTKEITKAEFRKYRKEATKAITKKRYYYKLNDELTAEVDLYQGDLKGLNVVEVEFPSIEQEQNFVKPDWFGKEVTDSKGIYPPVIAGMEIEEAHKLNQEYEQKPHEWDVDKQIEEIIVAKARLEDVMGDFKYEVKSEIKGADLLGLTYEPLFDIYVACPRDFRIYEYEGQVTMDDGVGIVHSAPGFGDVDTQMGMHYGLSIMMTLDDEGKFIPGTQNKNPYEGIFYKDADLAITADLMQRDLLLKDEKILHRFPYHDRCDTNLVQKAQKSWFINIQKLKKDLLKHNEQINWVPGHLKEGRFKKGVEQAPDWCISRTRFWATPMPVWESEDGDRIVIGSREELEELSGQKVPDLHRPFIDEVEIKKDGKIYKRRTEVLDSWFEAGSMPYAQVHYPFENEEKFKASFPGDYIVEYIAQVRAWFYVMHVLCVALYDSHAFKNVISTGVLAGNDGRKMSKTYGNYTDPKDVLENVGGEALRLYLMNSPLMVGDNASWSDRELKDNLKNILIPFWNAYRYFILYANLNDWMPKDPSDFTIKSDHILDKWLKSYLDKVTVDYEKAMDAYNIPASVRLIQPCIDNLSTWWIRRSRKRFADGDTDAIQTLYAALLQLIRTFAPQMPFITEEVFQNLLVGSGLKEVRESVHLEDFPKVMEGEIDNDLLKEMETVQKVCSLGLNIRTQKQVRIRQPLSKAFVRVESEELRVIVREELNVKEIEFIENPDDAKGTNISVLKEGDFFVALELELSDELKEEGLINELLRTIQKARKQAGCNIGEPVAKMEYFTESEELKKVFEKHNGKICGETKIGEIVESDGAKEQGKEYKFDDYILTIKIKK